MPILLGSVADDVTGATDLANTLVRGGMRTVQMIGVPAPGTAAPDADAVVVALKSRTAPVGEAVAQSLAALAWLRSCGAAQVLFKVCSTFDSTDAGNIGPVADALLAALGAPFAPVCPAFPANGRTVYQGHLFVGSALLNESGMEKHPLTPMTDANLVRVLGRQSTGTVGLVPYATVAQGPDAIRRACLALPERGHRYAIVDALSDAHLESLGAASSDLPLLVGGSGIAIGLPENFRRSGRLAASQSADRLDVPEGHTAVIAGSCSRATLGQIGLARDHVPTLELDPLAEPDALALAARALAWAEGRLGARPIVIAASATPDRVALLQERLGREAAGALVETALSEIAAGLVARGVRRLIVAGGETSGAVVQRLGITRLRIGPEIDPGVPWTRAEGGDVPLLLALKSGNFGARDFFLKAFEMLEQVS
ncbi:four-carbon acid sugar kinase family protein [Elioraea tepida]|uniref:3-oxo-tetronate kinase n=1 Tax=Elioraea tepida TaxID=2843330 RepID=A0A975YIV2_9PROT|nr:3-oxo-tetronate kinase [Elioraea tepida]QXM23979.1 four-carbon acid sugar kinase family protein [Elioraea tepida]